MSTITTVPATPSKQELNDWIMAQPADRRLDFSVSSNDVPCSCLFIEWGKEKFPQVPMLSAGVSTLYEVINIVRPERDKKILANMPYWFDHYGRYHDTFGELQAAIREREQLNAKNAADDTNTVGY